MIYHTDTWYIKGCKILFFMKLYSRRLKLIYPPLHFILQLDSHNIPMKGSVPVFGPMNKDIPGTILQKTTKYKSKHQKPEVRLQ